MQKLFILCVLIIGECLAAPQFIVDHSSALYRHPAVIVNSEMEDALPNELRNDFYKNPLVAADLAKESLLTEKEMQVVNRDADDIPRERVYSILHNAGFVSR
ncbi:uncharacterized protein LOC127282250 [Leptopilina boulardi]|uniref:uncharacterized protein LOC127282250 n=1 Tax=Leptopilina boulardi TaxID=63433 RepID=UPI0021F50E01|nr:uncharacterized protein LOC127282250 [Leptopilina boulardi]